MTEAEKIICKMYLENYGKYKDCNEYKLLMGLLEQEPCEEQDIYEKAYKEGYDKGWNDGNFIGRNRWIPVSERLPEKNGEYLITGRRGAVNKRRYHDGHWYSNWSVLAWMPLPESYKAEARQKVRNKE